MSIPGLHFIANDE